MDGQLVTPHSLPLWLDLGSIAIGAIYGATLATARRAPLIGVFIVAVLMGVGGGMIRDILLGTDIAALVNPHYMQTMIIGALLGAFFGHWLTKPKWIFPVLDSIVMALFVIIGTEKSFLYGMPIASSIFIGTLAAIGGSVLSDLLLGDRPAIMTRGPWNTSIALVSAIFLVILLEQGLRTPAEILTILLSVLIRTMALWKGWSAPTVDHFKPTYWKKR